MFGIQNAADRYVAKIQKRIKKYCKEEKLSFIVEEGKVYFKRDNNILSLLEINEEITNLLYDYGIIINCNPGCNHLESINNG